MGAELANYLPPRISGYAGAEVDSLREFAKSARRSRLGKGVPAPLESRPVCMISGDLSATGDGIELQNAFNFVQDALRFVFRGDKVGLRYKTTNLNIVMGNHDIWGGQSALRAWIASERKHARASALLGNLRPVDRWSVQVNGRKTDYVDLEPLRIRTYLLDSTKPGLMNVLARGRVPSASLDELQGMLEHDRAVDAAAPRISHVLRVAMLHHPVEFERHRMKMLLENRNEVRDLLNRWNFGLILAGHEHEMDLRGIKGTSGLYQCIAGTPTQTQRDRALIQNTFVVLDVYEGNLSTDTCEIAAYAFERPAFQGTHFQRRPLSVLRPRVVPA